VGEKVKHAGALAMEEIRQRAPIILIDALNPRIRNEFNKG